LEVDKYRFAKVGDDRIAHYNLGVIYILIGDRNSALKEYKILKELDIDLANKLFDSIY